MPSTTGTDKLTAGELFNVLADTVLWQPPFVGRMVSPKDAMVMTVRGIKKISVDYPQGAVTGDFVAVRLHTDW